jgi:hypothetical protein
VRLACSDRFEVTGVLRLEMTPGVQRVAFNPVTRTVLVHYHAEEVTVDRLLQVMHAAAVQVPPGRPVPPAMGWRHIFGLMAAISGLLWAESVFGFLLAACEVTALLGEVHRLPGTRARLSQTQDLIPIHSDHPLGHKGPVLCGGYNLDTRHMGNEELPVTVTGDVPTALSTFRQSWNRSHTST